MNRVAAAQACKGIGENKCRCPFFNGENRLREPVAGNNGFNPSVAILCEKST
jgi:hypothetical protein